MFAYFFGGFWYLNMLLKKKNLNLKLGLVGTGIMPKEDFKNLLKQVQDIKDKMQDDIDTTGPPAPTPPAAETEESEPEDSNTTPNA